jgi:RNA polymerase sigma-70 factor (ECF subfamily)
VSASGEALAEARAGDCLFDFEAAFRSQYQRVARIIARVVRDRARAEELAVEVFLKLWRDRKAQGQQLEGWLCRVAVRTGLNELRRQARQRRYESVLAFLRSVPNPEEIRAADEERDKVRAVLRAVRPRDAELLVLRSHGLTYDEMAAALSLNPASVGTLLRRAQVAFRKEYIERYGEE